MAILCVHGKGQSYCKECRSVYDKVYAENYQKKYYAWLSYNGCESCGFSHPFALEVHHLATEYKRYGRSQSANANKQDIINNKALILCGNCHNIFHGNYGGRMKSFPILSKEETIAVIKTAKEN